MKWSVVHALWVSPSECAWVIQRGIEFVSTLPSFSESTLHTFNLSAPSGYVVAQILDPWADFRQSPADRGFLIVFELLDWREPPLLSQMCEDRQMRLNSQLSFLSQLSSPQTLSRHLCSWVRSLTVSPNWCSHWLLTLVRHYKWCFVDLWLFTKI